MSQVLQYTHEIYYKVTNRKEKHHGFQYRTGLNVLREEFNPDSNQTCCKGGFYFVKPKDIFKYLTFGVYVRKVILPDHKDFKMIKLHDEDVWRANMIVLGEKYDLSDVETFKMFIKEGANLHDADDAALRFSAEHGYLETVKLLIEQKANVHASNNYALKFSASNGHLDVVKYLVQYMIDQKKPIDNLDYDMAIQFSASNCHFSVTKFLVQNYNKVCSIESKSIWNNPLMQNLYTLGLIITAK